jgi:hypothetical protein
VCENRVPRRIFGPKRDEVTGGWRKLHNKELHCCAVGILIPSHDFTLIVSSPIKFARLRKGVK